MFSKLNREVTNKQAALVLNCSAANKKKLRSTHKDDSILATVRFEG